MEVTIAGDRVALQPGDEVFIPGVPGPYVQHEALLYCRRACLLAASAGDKTWWQVLAKAECGLRVITVHCLPAAAGVLHSTKNTGEELATWLYGYG